MSIQFKKNLAGQVFVLYDCENCGSPLKSKVDEIGIVDDCPKCSVQFVVPGRKEYDVILRRKEAQVAATEAERAERQKKIDQDNLINSIKDHKNEVEEDISFDIGFPGNLIKPALEFISSRNDDKTQEKQPLNYRLTSILYSILMVLFVIINLIILLSEKPKLLTILNSLITLILGIILMAALHYGNYLTFSMRTITLKEPTLKIRSKSILHLVAIPFFIASFTVIAICVQSQWVEWIIGLEEEPDAVWKLCLLLGTKCLFGLIFSSPLLAVVSTVLSPNAMGIKVSRKSTSIDNVLAICALIIRAPLYFAPIIHSAGLYLGILVELLAVYILLFTNSSNLIKNNQEILNQNYLLFWPPVAYLFTTINMFLVELIFLFVEMVRAIKNENKNPKVTN